MEILGNCSAIGAADMMEVAPDLDPTDTTSLLAARALERYLQSQMSHSLK
jgi:arginase family enzyme